MTSTAISRRELRDGYSGKPFFHLVEHHLIRMGHDKRLETLRQTLEWLSSNARALAEQFINDWNERGYDEQFWASDCADVFDAIVADARRRVEATGENPDDETLFNLFNIVVMNFAYAADKDPRIRKFVKRGDRSFPWVSATALIYPLGAAAHLALSTPAPPHMVAGYGVANLGYLLVAAGIFAGSFRIFGLKRRIPVFVAAGIAIVIGVVLSNIDA